MIKTITLSDYENYMTEWICSTSEQWNQTGLEIIFTLECDDNYYYLTVECSCNNDVFYDEHPEYDRADLEYTKMFCNDFGCKICENLSEVNSFVLNELPSYCEFVEDEEGFIYGH